MLGAVLVPKRNVIGIWVDLYILKDIMTAGWGNWGCLNSQHWVTLRQGVYLSLPQPYLEYATVSDILAIFTEDREIISQEKWEAEPQHFCSWIQNHKRTQAESHWVWSAAASLGGMRGSSAGTGHRTDMPDHAQKELSFQTRFQVKRDPIHPRGFKHCSHDYTWAWGNRPKRGGELWILHRTFKGPAQLQKPQLTQVWPTERESQAQEIRLKLYKNHKREAEPP